MLLDHCLCYQTDGDPVSTKVARNLSDVIPFIMQILQVSLNNLQIKQHIIVNITRESAKLLHHVKASTSVKRPTANVKPNLMAINITTRNNSENLQCAAGVAAKTTHSTSTASEHTDCKISTASVAAKSTDSSSAAVKSSHSAPMENVATVRSFKICVPFRNIMLCEFCNTISPSAQCSLKWIYC